MYIRKFEVKTGKNKGYYLVTDDKKDKTYKKISEVWGILVYDYNYGLYKYHNVKPNQLLWTHSIWAYGVIKDTYNHYK